MLTSARPVSSETYAIQRPSGETSGEFSLKGVFRRLRVAGSPPTLTALMS